MSWLKRIDSLALHQSLDIPFITFKNGVYLCFDNFYSEQPQNTEAHSLCFSVNKNQVFRKSTYYYSLKEFPVIIPFKDILSLDDVVKEGQVIKESVPETNSQTHHVAVVKTKYLKRLSDRQFDNFIDAVDGFKRLYVLNNGVVDDRVHVLADILDSVKVLYHKQWGRTVVTILNDNSEQKKGLCWTRGLPQIQFTNIGINDGSEMDEITDLLSELDVNYSVHWL